MFYMEANDLKRTHCKVFLHLKKTYRYIVVTPSLVPNFCPGRKNQSAIRKGHRISTKGKVIVSSHVASSVIHLMLVKTGQFPQQQYSASHPKVLKVHHQVLGIVVVHSVRNPHGYHPQS